MNMKRVFRRPLTVVLAAFVVSALALPAFAGVESGDIVVQGDAIVGERLKSGGTIPQNGKCVPEGKGLHAPAQHGSGKNKAKPSANGAARVVVNKEVYYNLSTAVPASVITDTNDAANSGVYTGTLDVCGIVSPGPGGIGAACGSSIGRDGKGKLNIVNSVTGQRRIYDLQDVAWVLTVGGVLPVYGHITRIGTGQGPTDPDPATKTTKYSSKGTFEGEVTATGGADCLQAKTPEGGGATSFGVVGTVAAEALGKPTPKPREQKLTK